MVLLTCSLPVYRSAPDFQANNIFKNVSMIDIIKLHIILFEMYNIANLLRTCI